MRDYQPIGTKEFNPFARGDSILRSPPRSRTFSLSELETSKQSCVDQRKEKKFKRKRKGSISEKNTGSSFNHASTLRDILKEVMTQTEILQNIVAQAYRPKAELCEVSRQFVLQVEKLINEDTRNEGLEDLIIENEKLLRQNRSIGAKEKFYQRKNARRQQLRRKELKKQCLQNVGFFGPHHVPIWEKHMQTWGVSVSALLHAAVTSFL